jgi:hypothetical protein
LFICSGLIHVFMFLSVTSSDSRFSLGWLLVYVRSFVICLGYNIVPFNATVAWIPLKHIFSRHYQLCSVFVSDADQTRYLIICTSMLHIWLRIRGDAYEAFQIVMANSAFSFFEVGCRQYTKEWNLKQISLKFL